MGTAGILELPDPRRHVRWLRLSAAHRPGQEEDPRRKPPPPPRHGRSRHGLPPRPQASALLGKGSRGTVPVAVLCRILPHAPQSRFRYCGPSASYIAAFDPRSRRSDAAEGTLFYFAVVKWALPLSFPRLDPQLRR